jgi:hypothetical protein
MTNSEQTYLLTVSAGPLKNKKTTEAEILKLM